MSNNITGKKEINYMATLEGIYKRQERLLKIKEKKNKKNKEKQTEELNDGLGLLFNILKEQNKNFLSSLQKTFKENLSYSSDLPKEFVKPPYLTPKIVSHKKERYLNQI
jgi:uncharacterized protein (DUF927 family)